MSYLRFYHIIILTKYFQTSGSTRHLRILNERTLDEPQKAKLEQSIRERLQKSGLDNIGKFGFDCILLI